MPVRTALAARRKARGYTQEDLAQALGIARSTVVRWETGAAAPQPWTRSALAKTLGLQPEDLHHLLTAEEPACTTGAAPLESPAPSGLDDPVEFVRRTRLGNPPPSRVGRAAVEEVRTATRLFAASENLYGGGLSLAGAVGQLRWAVCLLRARASNSVHRELHEAVGNLAGVVGFSAFDSADHIAADRYFQFALWCAEQGDSWALRATTLTDLARQAAHLGDLDRAISLTELAQVRADRLPATARAVVWTVHARLLALVHRHEEAQADIDRADMYFADRDPSGDPPWLVYYDEAEHAGSTGRALIPVVNKTGYTELAAPRLKTAIRLQAAEYPRSLVFSRTRLATLTMMHGDPHEAVSYGTCAVEQARSLRSRRVVGELRGLVRASQRHARIGEVADLRETIGELAGVV